MFSSFSLSLSSGGQVHGLASALPLSYTPAPYISLKKNNDLRFLPLGDGIRASQEANGRKLLRRQLTPSFQRAAYL
jgi:hypothetical protein